MLSSWTVQIPLIDRTNIALISFLFKEKWVGDGIIGLSSKTYYCFGGYDKFSCKGVNKKTNEITKEKYLNVLLTKDSSEGLNQGFGVVDNTMFTYQQARDGFSYF